MALTRSQVPPRPPSLFETILEMAPEVYTTEGGVVVYRRSAELGTTDVVEELIDRLDSHRGALFASSYEYPGRYTRWDLGFCDPPVVLTTSGRRFTVEALNARGRVLLAPIRAHLAALTHVANLQSPDADHISGQVHAAAERFPEEERSKQPSVFSVVRGIIQLFFNDNETILGLYGAFGYDLCFQFEATKMRRPRPDDQRDMVLYIPDRVLQVDHALQKAWKHEFDFELADGSSTAALKREGPATPFVGSDQVPVKEDHGPGEYAAKVVMMMMTMMMKKISNRTGRKAGQER